MSPILGNIIVLFAILSLLPLLFLKKVRTSELWQATVTPLASIIGSGFLISAALVVLTTGEWAAVAMLVVVTAAYLLGSVMRFNIQHLEPLISKSSSANLVLRLETLSRPMLGVAYVISVAFYLKLLSIFTLQGFMIKNPTYENILTTLVLVFIGAFGWIRGLHVLEVLEKYAVNSKLIVITAMIIGHIFYNAEVVIEGNWFLAEHNHDTPFQAFQKLLGILIIIQGFETSRYLGQAYTAEIRIKSMRYAQIISGAIYVLFVSSAMVMFNDIHSVSETVVIDLCRLVAPVLPALLIFAAIMSQFSAAVADTIGSSGLISEATRKLVSIKQGILLTVAIAVLLVWLTNIYEIIVIASKAFALYYGMQCVIAARLAKIQGLLLRSLGFSALLVLMLLVIFLGVPVE